MEKGNGQIRQAVKKKKNQENPQWTQLPNLSDTLALLLLDHICFQRRYLVFLILTYTIKQLNWTTAGNLTLFTDTLWKKRGTHINSTTVKVSSLPANGTVLIRLEQTLHCLSMSPPLTPQASPAAFLAFKTLDFQGEKESWRSDKEELPPKAVSGL